MIRKHHVFQNTVKFANIAYFKTLRQSQKYHYYKSITDIVSIRLSHVPVIFRIWLRIIFHRTAKLPRIEIKALIKDSQSLFLWCIHTVSICNRKFFQIETHQSRTAWYQKRIFETVNEVHSSQMRLSSTENCDEFDFVITLSLSHDKRNCLLIINKSVDLFIAIFTLL